MKRIFVISLAVLFALLIISFTDSQMASIADRLSLIEKRSFGVKNRLKQLENNQDSLLTDNDHDGVSDYFDKNLETPEGYMVYGGGQCVDQDKDGICDSVDQDPFSTPGEKVNTDGWELDDDGDGVPNKKDQEPNTKPGAFVNFQGITITDKIGGAAVELIENPDFLEYKNNQAYQINKLKQTVFSFHSPAQNETTEVNDPAQDETAIRDTVNTAQIEQEASLPLDSLQADEVEFLSDFKQINDSLVAVYNAELLRHKIRVMKHRNGVFEWQLLSSKLIFGIVLIIVIIGLIFSWMQFKQVFKANTTPQENIESTESLQTEMEISKGGVKINSSVIGLIILALSFAFFYLYLVHVYPIEIVEFKEKQKTEINQ